jgi:2-polyprenyl-3-methyl-5-hydroxy-6-metoxy-1,4-benzoquinol methylase
MTIQEHNLSAAENAGRTRATSPEPLSLYEFGGSEDDIRRIQSPFVKFFREAFPVLDIGCGRGIFVEMLSEVGIPAMGLDHSDEAVSSCLKKGLQVHQEDARTFLSRTEQKFGGVFCSHVIEHLAYEDALELIRLCHRVLRPGGVLLLVTPNCLDLAVISEIFWLDPTHVRPYPTPLLRSMLERNGLRVILERKFVGHWRLIGRRRLLGYVVRRLVLGRYFGKPNALVLARKA